MLYQMAADLVLTVHLLFVLFVVAGGVAALRRQKLLSLHVPALLWAAWIEFSGGICPLTPLENQLRRLAGIAGYQGGFIDHYIEPLLYPPGLTRTTQMLLGASILIINCGLYGLILYRSRRNNRPTE